MDIEAGLTAKLGVLLPQLDERGRRSVAAAGAMILPHGGVPLAHRCCGLSRTALTAGMRGLRSGGSLPVGRARRPGGGRKSVGAVQPGLAGALDQLLAPFTRGDPESPLRWTCESTRRLATELGRRHPPVCHGKVAQALRKAGYSLQGNRETEEGGKAQQANGRDFPGPEVPRARPHGVCDLGRGRGSVNVGTSHDTATFSVDLRVDRQRRP